MIVWINGAFGGGKTHTAHELVRRTDETVLVDPELIGFGLQRSLPGPLRVDFQDLRSWRAGVVEVLDRVAGSGRFGAVVVPMTVVDPDYLDEIHSGLRALGHEVKHVALVASRETIRRRLRQRLAGLTGRETWAMRQVDRCLAAFTTMEAHQISNDQAGLDEVVAAVAGHAGLTLTAPPLRPWHARLRRIRVAASVIR